MISSLLTAAIAFPQIDPVIFQIGPLALRWYSLAYMAGLLLGWRYMVHMVNRPQAAMSKEHVGDFFVWATVGVILGGRLGSILFYSLPFKAQRDYILQDPLSILRVWEGGMSFHGGLIGVIIAIIWFAKRHNISPPRLGDLVGCAVPIGLFFGRIANFINGELYGRVSDASWAMVFPGAGLMPRHPSQLYEAGLEGAALFLINWVLFYKFKAWRYPGLINGVFLIGYAVARLSLEFIREPDNHIGFLASGITMGQLLSIPMIIGGILLIRHSLKNKIKPLR